MFPTSGREPSYRSPLLVQDLLVMAFPSLSTHTDYILHNECAAVAVNGDMPCVNSFEKQQPFPHLFETCVLHDAFLLFLGAG